MESYRRLTRIDRYQIKALMQSGMSYRFIASYLGRSPSSISREIKRNRMPYGSYNPKFADKKARNRRSKIAPPRRVDLRTASQIEDLLSCQFSPEQIRATFASSQTRISVDTIYKYIYLDHRRGGLLYLNLRRRRRARRSQKGSRNYKNSGKRVNQAWIAERPKIVEERVRIGDFERDTMLGKKGSPVLLTIVDRVTRFTRIVKVEKVNAQLTHQATIQLLEGLVVRTITNDNGAEFAFHKKTAEALKTEVYFNDPYCSWQRGTNENTNGLLRQYFPKGFDFNLVSDEDVKRVQDLLNSRPRKCLGFKTPFEVERSFDKVLY